MTDSVFVERIKRAQADATRRGLRIVGYEVLAEGAIRYSYAPLKPRRSAPSETAIQRVRRGVVIDTLPPQGNLL